MRRRLSAAVTSAVVALLVGSGLVVGSSAAQAASIDDEWIVTTLVSPETYSPVGTPGQFPGSGLKYSAGGDSIVGTNPTAVTQLQPVLLKLPVLGGTRVWEIMNGQFTGSCIDLNDYPDAGPVLIVDCATAPKFQFKQLPGDPNHWALYAEGRGYADNFMFRDEIFPYTDNFVGLKELASPAVSVSQTAVLTDSNGNGTAEEGETVTFSFVVTNTGPTSLNTVAVTDPLLGTITCESTSLALGAATTCTAEPYTLTAADIAAQSLTSVATATGRSLADDEATATNTVTVDLNTIEIAPTIPDAAVITGPAEGATVTTANPEFTGTATPGTKVEVIEQGTGAVLCTVDPVPASGDWACTSAVELVDGAHAVTAKVTASGGTSVSEPRAFTVDTVVVTVPDVAVITGPVEGATVTTSNPEFTGTATAGTKLEVVEQGTGAVLCSVDPVPANGNWACTSTVVLPIGSHAVSAKVTNGSGGSSVSEPRTFMIGTDTVPEPDVALITGPAEGTTVTTAHPEFTGTATPGTKVEVIEQGTGAVLCTVDPVPASGDWVCTSTSEVADGPHMVAARVTNSAGGTSVSEPRSFTVDTAGVPQPDKAVITGPVEGAKVTTSTPQFTGTATPGTTVEVVNQGTGAVLCTVGSVPVSGNWACTSTVTIADGAHTIVAKVTNTAGGTSLSDPRTFTINTAVITPTPTPTPSTPAPVTTASGALAKTGSEAPLSIVFGTAGLLLAGALGIVISIGRKRRSAVRTTE